VSCVISCPSSRVMGELSRDEVGLVREPNIPDAVHVAYPCNLVTSLGGSQLGRKRVSGGTCAIVKAVCATAWRAENPRISPRRALVSGRIVRMNNSGSDSRQVCVGDSKPLVSGVCQSRLAPLEKRRPRDLARGRLPTSYAWWALRTLLFEPVTPRERPRTADTPSSCESSVRRSSDSSPAAAPCTSASGERAIDGDDR